MSQKIEKIGFSHKEKRAKERKYVFKREKRAIQENIAKGGHRNTP